MPRPGIEPGLEVPETNTRCLTRSTHSQRSSNYRRYSRSGPSAIALLFTPSITSTGKVTGKGAGLTSVRVTDSSARKSCDLRFSQPLGVAKWLILRGNLAALPELCPSKNRIRLGIGTGS
jgi:hypothetical protein